MTRRTMLLWICVILILLATAWRVGALFEASRRRTPRTPPSPTSYRPPNILLISLDTVRPDHLGCYGYPQPTSPNLDRFAQSATRFSQARTQAPWTTPSHMSLFTSMLPSNHGIDAVPYLTLSPRIPTLALILQSAQYQTVGIVNNGGVESIWGFDRGFDTYEEYDHAKPEATADRISERALQWMNTTLHDSHQPWFLFLHYYDAHDPYDSPEPLRKQFGGVTQEEAKLLLRNHKTPEQPFENPSDLTKLTASYDAAIANLDSSLGKVLAAVPADTLVVVFSDHGEAFKEHGWLWHGSNLYEEEIRCALLVRLPNQQAGNPGDPNSPPAVIDQPVMLIDVAPTILKLLGMPVPPTFEGQDLRPMLSGLKLDPRPIASETKMEKSGRLLKSIALPPWKMIYNLYDGQEELYKLPDETHNLIKSEAEMAQTLRPTIQRWVNREHFWIIYATGPGEFKIDVSAAGGELAAPLPINIPIDEQETFIARIGPDRKRHIYWTAHPGNRIQAIYVQTLPTNVPLKIDCQIDGQPAPDSVFAGRSNTPVPANPCEIWIGSPGLAPPDSPPLSNNPNATQQASGETKRMSLGKDDLLSPLIDQAFTPPIDTTSPVGQRRSQVRGVYIRRYGDETVALDTLPEAPGIDSKRLERLKSLGYLR